MNDVDFRGRTDALSDLYAMPAGVVCIVGDSGVGKSQLLAALTHGWAPSDLVSHASVLGALSGSLQAAIADAIGECLAEYVGDNVALLTRISSGFESLLTRAVAAGSKELTQLLIASTTSAVETKLGAEAAKSLRSGLANVFLTSEEDIRSRIRQLSGPDVATTLLAYISETSAITSKRLIFRFDAGELLANADFALLGELASRAIDAFLMLVTVNSHHPGMSTKLAVLEARGSARYELMPLGTGEVEAWLADASVPEALWPTIHRKSAGYPFFVQDLIVLYSAGRLGETVAIPDGFDSLLSETWATLDRQLQAVATSLACFPEPPSAVFIEGLIGIDRVEWMTIRRSLRDSRVFITRPDGAVWFHDRRRDFIWRALEVDHKAAVAEPALLALQANLVDPGETDEWIHAAIPELLRTRAQMLIADPYLSQIANLSQDELAIMFALVELTEPDSPTGNVVDTASVGRFALSRLDLPEDPITALESLVRRGFISSESNEKASVTCGIFPSAFAFTALIAQMRETLQRDPIPMLGSTTFHRFLRPLIGKFELANISVGAGSLRSHNNSFKAMRKAHLRERDIGALPALGIDVLFGPQPVHTTVVFKTLSERNAAEAALNEYVPDSGSSALRITAISHVPPERVRLSRVARALSDFGEDTSAFSILEHAQQVTRVMEELRSVLAPEDASAINWAAPRSILIDIADPAGHWADIKLRGGTEAAVTEFVLADRHGLFKDPLLELKLRRDGLIRNSQVMEGWSTHSRVQVAKRPSPLQDVLKEFQEGIQTYNRGLRQIEVPLDESELRRLLSEERVSQHELSKRFYEASLIRAMPPENDTSLYLFLYPSDRESWLFESWMAYALVADDHLGDIVVKILAANQPHPPFMPSDEECIQFSLPARETHKSGTDGIAEGVLAPLLGWGEDDIRLPGV